MNQRLTPYWLLTPGLIFLLLLFVVPLVTTARTSLAGVEGGLLSHYREILTDPFFLTIIKRTVSLSAISTLICLALGYPVAYYLSRLPQQRATWLLALTVFPLLVNSVVRSFTWMVVLGRNGIINKALLWLGVVQEAKQYLYTPTAIVLGFTQLFLPLMILSLYSSLSQLNPDFEQAARGLGARPWTVFRRVTLPLSLPGMIVGVTLVFSATMTAYTTPQLLGGTRLRTLATMVYHYTNTSMNWPLATAIAVVMFALTLVGVAIPSLLVRPKG